MINLTIKWTFYTVYLGLLLSGRFCEGGGEGVQI